ncbi:hypothetical protein [Paenibacillus humicus]|uniref:hypothetical protein n=1 Tax=Paenibacillus humicus TaxID=412861 RepID=UPI003D2DB637
MGIREIVMMGLMLLILILAVLGVAAAMVKKKRAAELQSNVIYLPKKRTSSKSSDMTTTRNQKCSRCNQAKKLVFYSNDLGHVAGLCKNCRKDIGDKQELYPI